MNAEEFSGLLKQLSKRIEASYEQISTEEATKMSFIVPLFQILGYDVFNPSEFVPEFTADVGIKKGEKVDYAIFIKGELKILIEAKWCGERLEKYDSQLFRYFSTTQAKFGILTNGINYRFFTDLDEKNKMDEKPFLEINMLDLKETHVNELKKFSKDKFDVDKIFSSASELKYTTNIKNVIDQEINNPSDNFVKVLIADVYDGARTTQKVVDDFRVLVKKSFTQYINEKVNDRLKGALEAGNLEKKNSANEANTVPEQGDQAVNEGMINTTDEELQSLYIIKGILAEIIPLDKITYKDTESYFAILLQNNTRKWLCRIKLGDKARWIKLPGDSNNITTINLKDVEDLYHYKKEIINACSKYVAQ